MQTDFKFTVDLKVKVWSRAKVSVKADSLEEAKKLIINQIKKCDIPVDLMDDDNIQITDFEYLYDTEEASEDKENATVYLENRLDNDAIIFTNEYR